MIIGTRHVLQNIVGDGGDGGAPATTDATTLVNEISSANTQGQETTSAEPSLLSSAQTESGTANQPEETNFPNKFLVKNEDGTVDTEASNRKLLDAYNHLSKKMGETGGVVPDSADDYKIDFDAQSMGLPEGVTPDLVKRDADFSAFTKEAHAAGFTNEQINLVAKSYLNVVQSVLDRRDENDITACNKALSETYTTPGEKDIAIRNAQRAFAKFAPEQYRGNIDDIGNNPIVIGILANVGALLGEDSPANNRQPSESRETITALMKSDAYMDPKHPDHDRVYRQVSEYYRQAYGD